MPQNQPFAHGKDARHFAPDAVHQHLLVLKLAAYAMDALRVLSSFQRHADASPAFDQALKRACRDWRNPGSLNDPMDLIAETLAALDAGLSRAMDEEVIR